MEVLRKDMIEQWIIPHLNTGTRGPEPGVVPAENRLSVENDTPQGVL